MVTDFFKDLLEPGLGREHPVFMAPLYAFCPAAARWWLAGAEPVVPFDPLWAALKAQSEGRTLREALEELGLGSLLPFARKYVERVQAYRAQPGSRRLRAPELLPTFQAERLPLEERLGLENSFAAIGGWENFYPFVRAWAFTIPDWRAELKLASHPVIERRAVRVAAVQDHPARLNVWSLQGGGQPVFAFLTPDVNSFNILLGGLLDIGLMESEGVAELYALDAAGRVLRFRNVLGVEEIRRQVVRIAGLGRKGPYPPLVALRDPQGCRQCAFTHLCWQGWSREDMRLTPIALDFGG